MFPVSFCHCSLCQDPNMNSTMHCPSKKLYTLYLQTPARTRNAMKRNNPVQTPGSPTIGAATSMKTEEISPTSTYPWQKANTRGKKEGGKKREDKRKSVKQLLTIEVGNYHRVSSILKVWYPIIKAIDNKCQSIHWLRSSNKLHMWESFRYFKKHYCVYSTPNISM